MKSITSNAILLAEQSIEGLAINAKFTIHHRRRKIRILGVARFGILGVGWQGEGQIPAGT